MDERERGGLPTGHGLPGSAAPEPPAHDPVAPATAVVEPAPDARDSIDALAAFVAGEAGRPIDVWAVAALLESAGIRDRDARERFGREDVFALARAVQARLPEVAEAGGLAAPALPRGRAHMLRLARIYARGTFFFIPLSLQLAALLVVGVSLFAAIDFTTREASVVSAAAALAFVVTAGWVQALGYLAPLSIASGKHVLAEKVCWRIVGLAMASVVAFGGLVWVIARATGAYPAKDLGTASGYYLLIAAQALAGALLLTLRKYLAMVAATVLALAVAGLLYKHSSLEVREVHWAGLAVGVAFQGLVAFGVLRRRAIRTTGDERLARLPRVRLLARRAWPFGLYGLLYFAFLSTDRVLAWAAGSHPLPLWFHSSYELALDWALAAVVFALAFLEITVESFSALLVPTASRFAVNAVGGFNRSIVRFWARQLAWVGGLAAAGTWVAVGIAWLFDRLGWLGDAEEVYTDPVARYVFGLAVIGYALLALGIANSVFLMSLNRPWRSIAAIGPALLVTIGIGIAMTTRYAYWTSVFGMVCGAGLFALISTWLTWRTLHRTDYYNYSAW